MRLGKVIGRVTLNRVIPELQGARWLIVSPYNREHFPRGAEAPEGLSKEPSLVIYDALAGPAFSDDEESAKKTENG